MKKIIGILITLAICFSFSGCCLLYDYDSEGIDGFEIGYSRFLNDAFLSTYNWDGDDETTQIVIPDEYDGMPITALGGYYGRGVPCCFYISPTDEAKKELSDKSTDWHYRSNFRNAKITKTEVVEFNVHIGKNIEDIRGVDLGGIYCCEYTENEALCYDVFVFLCSVSCDEENEVFYAKDGKLYYRQGDLLVDDILYYDFDFEKYMSEQK